MRTRAATTMLAAVLLLALTACSSSDDGTDAAPTGTPSTPAAASAPAASATPAATPADAAELERAVRAYTAAYFADKPDTTYGMLSARCEERITPEAMAALTERAVGDYGRQEVQRFRIDQLSGDMARVSYGVGLPKFDQKQQPWVREDGAWKYDAC
ncbi:hypothetical protein [Streptomyces sp. JB150]|uniref:hypothetical protein n=1 Tax=Streptomyces sp. JB150 TaxID=2714844 RepID=UPI00140B82AF|nr:hypothetical protein [Streptomyces sp. JB150]QIJ61030.1 hypothetical protein G7Z13_02530 [Streptomyces sp. JB150]